MKQIVMLAAGLLLPLGQSNAAEPYFNLQLGSAAGDTDASQLDSQLAAQGLNATASSSDDSRTAWRVGVGYPLTSNWAVELARVDLGKVTTRFSGTTTDIDTFLTSASDIHPQTAKGWQLSGIYRRPVTEGSWFVARAGLFDWQSDYTLSSGSVSRKVSASGLNGSYGIGAEVDVHRYLRLGVNYDRYSVDGEAIAVVSAGLRFSME